eukprot:Pgem_evm1s13372
MKRDCTKEKCGSCGKAGHSTEKCFKNQTCEKCGKLGHIKAYCRLKKNKAHQVKDRVLMAREDRALRATVLDSGATSHTPYK